MEDSLKRTASSAARRALLLAAGAVLLGCVAQAVTAAAPACANSEIVVDAKTMEVERSTNDALLTDVIISQCEMRIQAAEAHAKGGLNFDSGQWTISGAVRLSAEGGQLTSDKAVVSFRNRLITQAVITGSPAQFEQQRDDGSTSRGRAGTIDYQTSLGTVSLTNDAWLTLDGKNQISGQTLVYNLRTQSMQGRPKASTPEKTGTGRIRIVIPARNPDEKPEKKP
jgi:lipopolysaccharide transport protein LptA